MNEHIVDKVVLDISRVLNCLPSANPVSELKFAEGVDVRQVVHFVLSSYNTHRYTLVETK